MWRVFRPTLWCLSCEWPAHALTVDSLFYCFTALPQPQDYISDSTTLCAFAVSRFHSTVRIYYVSYLEFNDLWTFDFSDTDKAALGTSLTVKDEYIHRISVGGITCYTSVFLLSHCCGLLCLSTFVDIRKLSNIRVGTDAPTGLVVTTWINVWPGFTSLWLN